MSRRRGRAERGTAKSLQNHDVVPRLGARRRGAVRRVRGQERGRRRGGSDPLDFRGALTPRLAARVWSTGVGSDIMKPIAAPIVGGMVTSTIHVLIITPVIFFIMKRRALRAGTLKPSGMKIQ
jgi:hypothetical protein